MIIDDVLFFTLVAIVVVVSTPGFILFYRSFRTTLDLSKRLSELERERRKDHEEINRITLEMTRLGGRLERWMNYAQRLAEIMRENGLTVPPSPEERDAILFGAVDPARLQAAIATQYNLEEIDGLAFDLGINGENLEGRTVERRAVSLVDYARRYGLTAQLIQQIRAERPQGGL